MMSIWLQFAWYSGLSDNCMHEETQIVTKEAEKDFYGVKSAINFSASKSWNAFSIIVTWNIMNNKLKKYVRYEIKGCLLVAGFLRCRLGDKAVADRLA